MDNYNLKYDWLDAKDFHEVVCCACKGTNATEEVFHFTVNGEKFCIKKCKRDGVMYLYPQFGKKFITALYNHPTYFQGTDDMYGLLVSEEKSAEIAQRRIKEILEKISLKKSILEIGCGYGHTLLEAKKAGFEITDGIELSDEAVNSCLKKGLNVYRGFTEDIFKNLKPQKYDIIALYSVLEHLEDPFKFLHELKYFLHDQSFLIVRAPNETEKGPWLNLIDHLWHFNEDSIRVMIQKIGFTVSEIFPSGTFKGIQHEGEMANMTLIAKLAK